MRSLVLARDDVVGELSFLAGTRNLMIMGCSICWLFYRWPCAGCEIRDLVLARDDVIVGTCCVLWMLTVFLTEEHKNKRFPLILECSCK